MKNWNAVDWAIHTFFPILAALTFLIAFFGAYIATAYADTITLDGSVITSNNTSTATITIASNSNRLMIVSYTTYQGGGPSGITYNGVALTKIVEQVGSYNEKTSIWGLIAPATGTHDVVVSDGGNWYGYAIYSLYNTDQSLPTNFSVTGNENSTASLSLTTVTDNSWVITSIEAEAVPTMTTSGGTSDWSLEGQSYQHGSGHHILKTSAGSQTMSASLSYSSRWNQANIEIKAYSSESPPATSTCEGSPTYTLSTTARGCVILGTDQCGNLTCVAASTTIQSLAMANTAFTVLLLFFVALGFGIWIWMQLMR